MFYIYIRQDLPQMQDARTRQAAGEDLVRQAAAACCRKQGITVGESSDYLIERTEKGKPCFPNLPIEFSVSHSGGLWICMVGDGPCGIDLQEMKACDYMKIAARFFSPQEQAFVVQRGLRGFYQIWTRREAFAKYTGDGLFGGPIPSFTDEEGRLCPGVNTKEGLVYVHELKLAQHPSYMCAYVSMEVQNEIYECQYGS